MRKYKQYQPANERGAARRAKSCARSFEQLSIRHTRRTCGLACTAAKAAVNVQVYAFVVRSDGSLEQRSHEKNSASRTFVLVLENLIRRTRLKTESAVDALINSGQRCCMRRIRQSARRLRVGRLRTLIYNIEWDAHNFGPRIPGFRMLDGSNAALTR